MKRTATQIANDEIKRIGNLGRARGRGRGSGRGGRGGGGGSNHRGRGQLLSTDTSNNDSNHHNHSISSSSSNRNNRSVLVVGTGLTGAICCHLIRRGLKTNNVRIEAIDMARGAGGRMSTTRQQMKHTKEEIRVNTGAQYVSCFTEESKRVLFDVCDSPPPQQQQQQQQLKIVEEKNPTERSLHFSRNNEDEYTHYSIPGGTNNLVKQFLYSGNPDIVSFQTRLIKLWKNNNNTDTSKKIIPEFDLQRRGGNNNNNNKNNNTNNNPSLSREYDAIVLALPPKDIIKFFHTNNNQRHRHDPQSQADLHRHYNKGNKNNNNSNHERRQNKNNHNYLPLTLDTSTIAKLRGIDYVGRYSLALWFDGSKNSNGKDFANTVSKNWQKIRSTNGEQQPQISSVLDAIFLGEEGGTGNNGRGNVLVAQSTVSLWRKYSGVSAGGGNGGGKQKFGKSSGNSLENIAGGGRQTVRKILVKALEDVYHCFNHNNNNNQRKQIPDVSHAKLLNWRTSQVNVPLAMPQRCEGDKMNKKHQPPLQQEEGVESDDAVVSTEGGQVIMTGDWCTESSYEGCYRAAIAASNLVLQRLEEKETKIN